MAIASTDLVPRPDDTPQADVFGTFESAFQPLETAAAPWLRGRIDRIEITPQLEFVPTHVPGRHQVLVFETAVQGIHEIGLDGTPDHYDEIDTPPGTTHIITPASNDLPHASRWSSSARFTSLSIEDAAFAAVAEAGNLDLAAVEFLDRFPGPDGILVDPFLGQVARALRDDLLAERDAAAGLDVLPAGRVYADALMQAAAAHVLRHHTAHGLAPDRYVGGLTRRQVMAARDYADGHLADDVSLADLAGAADLSPYHFAREFKRTTGETAHEMLRRVRMEHAAGLLKTTTRSVLDVALDVGYASPSRFAAAFRRRYGVAPSVYRRA